MNEAKGFLSLLVWATVGILGMTAIIAMAIWTVDPTSAPHERAPVQSVLSLEVSEATRVGRWHVTRVPCGWIYNRGTDPALLVPDHRCACGREVGR